MPLHLPLRLVFAFFACSVFGCGPGGAGATSPSPASAGPVVKEEKASSTGTPIVAKLSLPLSEVSRDADMEVVVTIENHGQEPLRFTEDELAAPALLFEVRDHLGNKVLPAPAPTPTGRARNVDAGKRIEVRLKLAGMFSPPLPPGEYSVRLRRVPSTPHAFRIRRP